MENTAHYKEILEGQLKQIIVDLKELGIQNPEIPTDWIATPAEKIDAEPDQNIASDRSEDWQERQGTVAALEVRFNNINRALKKIKNNTYGMCEICGNAIEKDRLEINPSSRTCKKHLSEEANLTR